MSKVTLSGRAVPNLSSSLLWALRLTLKSMLSSTFRTKRAYPPRKSEGDVDVLSKCRQCSVCFYAVLSIKIWLDWFDRVRSSIYIEHHEIAIKPLKIEGWPLITAPVSRATDQCHDQLWWNFSLKDVVIIVAIFPFWDGSDLEHTTDVMINGCRVT